MKAFGDQLLQNAVETLFGDPKNIQQCGDRQSRVPADEMQNAVMRASEAIRPPGGDPRRRRNPDRRNRTVRSDRTWARLPVRAARAAGIEGRFRIPSPIRSVLLTYRGYPCNVAQSRDGLVIEPGSAKIKVWTLPNKEGAMAGPTFDDRDGWIWFDGELFRGGTPKCMF